MTARMSFASARVRASVLLIGLSFALAALIPAGARAAGCENSWTNNKGGNWYEGANWSKKAVPVAGEEVCITLEGTYAVTETQTGGNVSLKALTIGAASGTQTLVVGSSSSANAVLATSAGIGIGAHGALTMTNGDASGNNVALEGPITNSGVITSETLHGGSRTLLGNLTNKGTLLIGQNTTFNASKAVLTNEGAINLAEGKQLGIGNAGSVLNGTGGSINGTGTGNLFMNSGTTFTEGAGTTSGTQPVIIDNAALNYTGSGSSLVIAHGTGNTVTGNIAAGQTLSMQSTSGENSQIQASASFSSAGTIVLTNGDTASNNAGLVITEGTLTNSGTINSELIHGGARYINGSVKNTGTININKPTTYEGASAVLTNESSLNIAEGAELHVGNKGSVINAAGSIKGAGSGDVFMGGGTFFTEGAGTTSGTQPVIIDNVALTYTGSGASLVIVHGTGSTVAGNIAAGQTLSMQSTSGENSQIQASASFSSAGTIVLTNGDTASNNAGLVITEGTLTNSGTINSELIHGGARYINGSVKNTGTININKLTTYEGASAVLTNESSLNIAEGAELFVGNKGSVVNVAGSIKGGATGFLFMSGGTFLTEGAGTTSGTAPLIIDNVTLTYTGSGSSLVIVHGTGSTITGNTSAGQTISLQSTSGENSGLTSAGGFTNAGTIVLTNGDAAANNATLVTTTGTLTNSGTIDSELVHGGQRVINGNLTNTGNVNINANTQFGASAAALVNKGTISIANGVSLSATSSPVVSNEAGGMIAVTGTGNLFLNSGTFNQGLGKTTTAKTAEPVIIDHGTLDYTDKGVSKIAQRGSGSLVGNINKKQTLSIESTCGENASDSSASFSNSGTINLTNADSCANNAYIQMSSGTLENKSTINVLYPHGGVREIEGNLVNEKNLALNNESSQALKVTGNYTQGAKATMKLTIAGASNYGRMTVGGALTLAGKLALKQSKFTGLLGEVFSIITAPSQTGTFTTVTGNAIKGGGLHYVPVYLGGVKLKVE